MEDAAPPAEAQLCAVSGERHSPLLLSATHARADESVHARQRVEALDSLSRKVVSDLRASQDLASSLDSAPRPPSRSFFSSSPAARSLAEGPSPPLDPTLAWKEPREPEPLGLERRLRIDNSGRLMLGQEHLFRDLLHPLPMPGSWLWGSVVLYE